MHEGVGTSVRAVEIEMQMVEAGIIIIRIQITKMGSHSIFAIIKVEKPMHKEMLNSIFLFASPRVGDGRTFKPKF